ncbi:MAG TPA: TlyA family RNA methyltransferase [Verrucomicrobiae bacterium]|jgi:23S rRNA (cytidine1920-2'-O)/16S rRNA (cytidine1409-2'-O)-methyltransferase|nr:TlyA family RNA methyltransferase [Verrucomicrobiae bacterium]
MVRRERLDKLLVERGLAGTRAEARRRILAGEVLVEKKTAAKAGSFVDSSAPIELTRARVYVSRGGEKLQQALTDFDVTVEGKIALDVGASTGGFTDCLISSGARLVYAVDVGHEQFAAKLRADPRVVLFEKTDIRRLKADLLPEPPALATIDAAFISLRLILPAVRDLLAPRGEIIALIKPQFEVGKEKIGKGVVRKAAEHARVIEEIKTAACGERLETLAVSESALSGAKGNKEFFIHLRKID